MNIYQIPNIRHSIFIIRYSIFLLLLAPLVTSAQCPAILSSSGKCGELTTLYNDPTASGGTNDAIFTFHGTGDLTAALPGGTPIFYEWFRFNTISNTYDRIAGNGASQTGLTDGSYLVRITDIFSTVCEDRAWIWNTDLIANTGADPSAICIGASTSLDGSNTNTSDIFTYYDPATFSETSVVDDNTQITLELDATHTFVSHLNYYLVGPSDCGSPSLLLGGQASTTNCNAGDDVNNLIFSNGSSNNFDVCSQGTPLTGAFGTNNGTTLDWTVFNGCNFFGNWRISIYDCAATEVGTLDDVALTLINPGNTTIYSSGPISMPINDNACSAGTATSYTIPGAPPPPTPINANNTTTSGNGITAAPDGGYEWSSSNSAAGPWTAFENSNLNPTVSPTTDTYYQLVVQDAAGCLSTDIAFLAVNQIHSVNAGPDQSISENESAVLNAAVTGATSGMWTGGAGLFADPTSPSTTYQPDPSETGTTVTLTFTTDTNACAPTSDMLDITIINCNTSPTLNGIANGDNYCEDDTPFQVSLTITSPGFYNINGPGITLISDPDGIPSNGDEIYEFNPGTANIAAVNGTDCSTNTISVSCLGDIGVFVYEKPIASADPAPKLEADCNETGEVIFTLDEMTALLSGGTGQYLMSYTAVDAYGTTFTVSNQALANITFSAAGTVSPVIVTINDSDTYYNGTAADPSDPTGIATLNCDGNACETTIELAFEYCCPFIPAPTLVDTTYLCQGDFYNTFQGISAACGDCIDPATGTSTGPGELTWWNTPTAGGQVYIGTTFTPTNETSQEGTPFDINSPGSYTYYAQCACMGCLSERRATVIIVQPLPTVNNHELLACESPIGSAGAAFTLEDASPFIDLSGTATVTYHPSLNEAQNNVNAQNSPFTSQGQTLTARVTDPMTGCTNYADLTLTIKSTPSIFVNIKRCEADIEDEILSGSDPSDDVSTADITVTFVTPTHAPLTLTVADIDGNNGILNGPLTVSLNAGTAFYTFTEVQIVSDGVEVLLLEAILDDGSGNNCTNNQAFGPYTDCSCLQYACVENMEYQAQRATGFNGGLGFTQNYALADPSGTILQWDTAAIFDASNLTPGAFYPIYAINYAIANEADVLSILDINFIYEPTDACLQVAISPAACHLAIVPENLDLTGPADLCSNIGQLTIIDAAGGFDPDVYAMATENSPNGNSPYAVFVFNEGESFENGDTPILGPEDGSDSNMPLVFTPINVAQPTVFTLALEDGTGCTHYEDFVVHPNYDATIQPDPITICLSSNPSNPTADFDLTSLLPGTTPPIYDRPGRFSGLTGIVNNPDLVTQSNSIHYIPGGTLDALLPTSGTTSFTLTYTLGQEYVLPPGYAFCPVSASITVNVSRPDAPVGTPYSHCEGTSVPVGDGLLSDCAATTNWYAADAVTLLAQTATGAPFVPSGIDTLPPGLYTYYLECVISPDCISPKSSVNLSVLPKPAKPTITTNSPVCIGNDINLNIQQSYTSATYNWTNGAGTNIGTTNSINIASNDANAISPYSVQVTAGGCLSDFSDPTPVAVTPLPIATATNDGPICPGEDVQLFAGTIADATYQWTIAGATTIISTQQNPILSNVPSNTDYELTVIHNACSSNPLAQTSVVVNTIPTANPTANYTLNGDCSPSDLTLTTNPSGNGPFSFTWTGPNGFSSIAENPAIPNATTANNGDYTVTVTDNNACEVSQVTSISSVENQVAEPVITSTGPACLDGMTVLSVAQYTGSSVTYSWTLPSGTNISGTNSNEITISPVDASHAGDYSVVVEVDGCTLPSDIYTLPIHSQPGLAPTATTTDICEGGTLELFANATGGNTYSWAGPNGFTSTAPDPILTNVTVANNGGYTVTTTSINGCETVASVNVSNILLSPTTPTISSNSPVCETGNIVLNIQENYTGTTIAYEWTNSAGSIIGTTSSINIPANAPTALSPFSVQVTVDGCVSNTSEAAEIIINPTPIATATNDGPVCEGDNVQLLADFVANASYQWRVQGNPTIISIAQNPTINNVNATTIYELTVIAEGCVSNPLATTEVLVSPPPTASPSTPNTAVCEGESLQLFANATNGTTFEWNGPNGFTSFAENPILPNVDVGDNGSYVLNVSSGNGCSFVSSLSLTNILAKPNTPFILSNSPVCTDDSIRLNIQQNYSGTVTFEWTNAGGMIVGTDQNVVLAANDAMAISPFSVLVNVDGCSTDISAPAEIIINNPSVTTASNNGPVCEGGDVNLYGGTVNNASYEWRVLGNPAIISTTQNPTIFNLAATTTYELTAIANGCTSTAVATTVTVHDVPVISNINGGGIYCQGSTVALSAENTNSNGMSTLSYTWSGPNGYSFTATTNPNGPFDLTLDNVTENNEGAYTLILTSDQACSSPAASVNVLVNPLPQTPSLTNNGPLCAGDFLQLDVSNNYAGTAISYEYFFNGTSIDTTNSPTYTISNAADANTGLYTVIATIDGCTTLASNSTFVEVTTPTAPTPTATNTTVCEGETINLFAGQIADAYQWTGPGGFSSSTANPSIPSATASNAGQISLVVTNNGCPSPAGTIEIIVNTKPMTATAISNSPICEGTDATLSVSAGQGGATATYQWFDAVTNAPLGVAAVNSDFTISNVSLTDAGAYYVIITENDCPSLPSNVAIIDVDSNPGDIANAGEDIEVCEGTTVNLQANNPVGTGLWTSTSTATIVAATSPSTAIENLEPGIHEFTWTVSNGSCIDYSSDMATITVTPVAADLANAGPNQSLCAITTTNLEANGTFSDPGVEGYWTQSTAQANQGVIIVDPTDPNTEVTGLFVEIGTTSSNFIFTWALSFGLCVDYDADEVQISINKKPNEFADAGEDLTVCDGSLLLTGNPSILGTGTWTSLTSAVTFDEANNPAAMAENLIIGENILIWSFSNGACSSYSTDTLRITREMAYSTTDLDLSNDLFDLEFNTELLDIDLFGNDLINAVDFEVEIIENGQNGTVMEDRDKVFSFRPNKNYLGDDSFTYSICLTNTCGSYCDTAMVSLFMNISDECWVPNIITPNSNDDNEFLIIPCLENYPDHQLVIFNRWGDKVYEAAPYNNDWRGTFNDNELPQGTYFYTLILDKNTGQKKAGFVTLHR